MVKAVIQGSFGYKAPLSRGIYTQKIQQFNSKTPAPAENNWDTMNEFGSLHKLTPQNNYTSCAVSISPFNPTTSYSCVVMKLHVIASR